MLGLVKTALLKPYTFIVLAIFICIVGPMAALKTPTDVFPDIGIPVVAVVWQYAGLSPDAMAGRVIYTYERSLSTTVNDIEHIESQSLPGMGIVKIFFQPGVDIRTANAQVTAVSQTVLKQMPAGITPPLILNYNASTVPILQMAFSSPTLSEARIRDLVQNSIRLPLSAVPGLAMPTPMGGKQRQITLDLDPQALAAKGLSAQDVGNALAAGNQIIPVGTAKMGQDEYTVLLNNSPKAIDELNDLPIKTVDGALITIGQVAHVRDGSPPQTNVVRVDGRRAVLMPALKNGNISTLSIIDDIRSMLPRIDETLPPALKTSLLGDASVFVKESVGSVAREGIIAALLTSAMILLFLGSWRSTIIIAASNPLAVLSAIALLSVTGQTLNVMTLGGLALAVGILVDDATVTIENINWHLEQGKAVKDAILDGARQIVGPAFVSLLCICIVFVPMFMLQGIAGYLFRPMALAVIFAMGSSFLLSRTLVPTLAMFLLKPHVLEGGAGHHPEDPFINHHEGDQHGRQRNAILRGALAFQQGFEKRFSAIRDVYHGMLGLALKRRKAFVLGFLACVLASFALLPSLGEDFFPATDAGALSMHVRLPLGTRIEESAAAFDRIEKRIREIIPASELDTVIDNIGIPLSGIDMAYSASGTIGPQDGDIQVTLKEGHAPTADYVKRLREALPQSFPGSQFAFLPADISSQILNFGSPAPLDVKISGPDNDANRAYAVELQRRLQHVAGIADLRIQQSTGYPSLRVNVDRLRAKQLGITEKDVTTSLGASLAGTSQVAPTYWLNPKNGVSYSVVAATPQYRLDSLPTLEALPITGSDGQSQILGGLATIKRVDSPAVVTHYNIQPTLDLFANVQERDLGGVAKDVQKVIDGMAHLRPKGATITLHGQIDALHEAFSGLSLGLLGAVVLIYLLIVVNFQSWTDPFVIITALPAALAGIVWMLFLSGTSLSVPALTGAILCMGVATANSILVVSFCRERLAEHGDALLAALEAGYTRFRPVCMTALAMIIGMLPLAISQEQNAPLGRAVIGGLILATTATLLFVPVVFSLVHRRSQPHSANHQAASQASATDGETPMSSENAPSRKRLMLTGIGGLTLAALLVANGLAARTRHEHAVAAWTESQSLPVVSVISPSQNAQGDTLQLPARLEAWSTASINARVSGYLKDWSADIGSQVQAGQVLARIDSPELDEQLAQTRAHLAQQKATTRIAQTTAERWQHLLATHSVSQQEVDEKVSAATAAKADLQAANADYQRLTDLAAYKTLRAPFNGTVTARNTDIGQLVKADDGGGTPLFSMADTHRLRLYVPIPQNYASVITPGMRVRLSVPEHPGQTYTATLLGDSTAVDPRSGTLLAQFVADNPDGALLPGDYADATLPVTAGSHGVSIPASALIFRAKGTQVATLDSGGHVHLRNIHIAMDLGDRLVIDQGLQASDKVVDNPPDALRENDPVQLADAGGEHAPKA